MFKTIQIAVTGHEGDGRALDAGFAVAHAFNAHADCLHVRFDPVEVATRTAAFDVPGIDASKPFIDALKREDQTRTKAARVAFDTARKSHKMGEVAVPPFPDPSAKWVEIVGDEYLDTVARARFHDLLVVDRAAEFGEDRLSDVSVACGRPILLPSSIGIAKPFGATVAIAWKETPEAARAVTAAMPFLMKATRVIVLSADETGAKVASTLKSAEHLAESLRWHGIKSEGRVVVPGERDSVDVVFAEAAQLGAELVVMGAYGHSRAREWIFGGFTRSVMKEASLPVLMMH